VSTSARIWLVGCGNMGSTMLRRWIASGVAPESVTVIDPFALPVPAGVTLVPEAPASSADVIVLAVKPQQLDTALSASRTTGALLVSILAGVEEATLRERFDVRAVVRAMPNLPVGIAKGVIALHSADAGAADRETAQALMAPLGLVEWIADEALFDAVTALSGSGPGFVYRFIEALAEAGAALGLPADQAQRFAIATVEGAAALAAASHEPPATLAGRVASPGGTTRAGLDILDEGDALKRLVHDTLAAAARRGAELAAAARK
jgi:pyrroline-5-carboxylate reductase